jgi:putative (di)nucleoside polyphosphate hydrolase
MLGPEDHRMVPWRNGGGTTADIAGARDAPGWAGTLWRFGTTTIPAPGPFSDLSGFDRILVPLGPGLTLHAADGTSLDARRPLRPVGFAGETPLLSALADGPVPVANLILRRDAFRGELTVPAAPARMAVETDETLLVHAVMPAQVDLAGVPVALPADHTLRIEQPGTELRAPPGVLLARIRPAGLPWRRNVGAAVFNRAGQVLVARRADRPPEDPHAWQMPQGGLDANEDAADAVLREAREEIGTDRLAILAEHPDWLCYDFPPGVAVPGGTRRHRGQMQRWFALRFLGNDANVRLDAHPPAEFAAWRWADLADLPALAVPFRRPVYAVLAEDFSPLAVPG